MAQTTWLDSTRIVPWDDALVTLLYSLSHLEHKASPQAFLAKKTSHRAKYKPITKRAPAQEYPNCPLFRVKYA